MLMLPQVEPVPLRVDEGEVVRVGETRVTLETVYHAFQAGASAEGIVEQYPALRLEDVYSVIAYILRHRDVVEQYVQRAEAEEAAARRQNEHKFSPAGVRERLLSRQGRSS